MRSTLGKLAGLGLFVVALSFSSGCVGRYYVNTTLYGYGEEPRRHDHPLDVPYVPVVSREADNTFAVEHTPAGVQSSFGNDYAAATVTHVEQIPTGTGQMMYRVTYIEDGAPGTVVYRGDGSVFGPGEGRVVVREDPDDYRPHPLIRPTTGPAQAELH